jgi:SAM-dependent methyltransferase
VTASAAAWTKRVRDFWEQRQRQAPPGALTGYLLDESPPSIGEARFEGEWRQVQGWLRRVPGGACLDLGCGTGVWLRALAPRFGRLEGWDLAPAMLRASRATLKAAGVRHVTLHCGDIRGRRGRACFDLVFVGGVLMYTPEAALKPLLKALRRLLKPGGLLILRESTLREGFEQREGLPLRPGAAAAPGSGQRPADYVAVYRSAAALQAALEAAGLRLLEQQPNHHYKRSELCEDWLWRLGLNGDPARAERWARRILRWRWLLLDPQLHLRRWRLENRWFLAGR